MKKLLLMAGVLLGTMAQAQTITVNLPVGTIENNQVFTFNELHSNSSPNSANVPFTVTNNTDATIYMKMRVDEMTNSDGSNVEFCFGQCFYTITLGQVIPSAPVPIDAGVTTAAGADHFFNSNPGIDTNQPVQYKLTFVQVDQSGNDIGDLLSFYYRYEPNAGTDDFSALKNMGLTLNQTLVKNELQITAGQNTSMAVFNMNGQSVKSAQIKSGYQTVDMSSLSNGVYILKFTNDSNQKSQIRIVKQ